MDHNSDSEYNSDRTLDSLTSSELVSTDESQTDEDSQSQADREDQIRDIHRDSRELPRRLPHDDPRVEDPVHQDNMLGARTTIISSEFFNATPRGSPRRTPRASLSRQATPDFGLGSNQSTGSNGERQESSSDQAFPDISRLHLEEQGGYDVEDEQLPSETFFDPTFQKALKSAMKLARKIDSELAQCALASRPGTDLFRIWKNAQEMEKFDCPETRIIGIVGDSASGKSSLINSLLHLPNLAHKGDHGSAVTSFVTEYRRRSPRHTEPFTIEVEFSTTEEMEEQLEELLFSYRQPYQQGLQAELGDSSLEYQSLERQSEVALATLQSIFPGREETSPVYLQDTLDGAFCRILDTLKQLASELRWPPGAVDGKWVSTAKTAIECNEKVGLFMQEGLWPLTEVVRIYLKAQVLMSGIILADLPGYRDTNLARVKKAEQYLIGCDEVFVVANIKRVTSDESVEAILKQSLGPRLKENKSITVICTHADVYQIPGAEKKHSNVAGKDTTKAAKKTMDAAYSRSAREYEIAKLKYKYLYVNARSKDVKAKLSRRYRDLGGKNKFHVYCVGNEDYEGSEYRAREARIFAAQRSGIPDLRRFCHSKVAEAQFKASNHFLEVEMGSLVQRLEVWIAALNQEVLPEIPFDCIPNLRQKLELKIESHRTAIEAALRREIAAPMRVGDGAFCQEAKEASQEWEGWHWTSYAAFCRHNGEHSTGVIGYRNWNADIMAGMNEALGGHWPALEDELERQAEILEEGVKREMSRFRRRIQGLTVPRDLIAAISTKEREILYLVREESNELLNTLGTIRINTTGTHLSSRILALMIPTYRACASEHGKGTLLRMHAHMAALMGRRSLFRTLRRDGLEATGAALDSLIDGVGIGVAGMCDEVAQQVDTVRGKEVEALKSCPEDVQKVRGVAAMARGRIDRLLNETEGTRRKARQVGIIS